MSSRFKCANCGTTTQVSLSLLHSPQGGYRIVPNLTPDNYLEEKVIERLIQYWQWKASGEPGIESWRFTEDSFSVDDGIWYFSIMITTKITVKGQFNQRTKELEIN
ncbi:MAG: hypothetical protein SVK08_00190 [Halobacteriota archaeon]|nr:hypothetical protein [Halobacteriota archaeon]